MLAFHWEKTDLEPNTLQGIFQTFTLAPLLFLKCFGSWKKEGKYNRNYILDFTPLWVATFSDYYSSIKDKYPTFYVSYSWWFKTSKFTDTNE